MSFIISLTVNFRENPLVFIYHVKKLDLKLDIQPLIKFLKFPTYKPWRVNIAPMNSISLLIKYAYFD
jgi:hypothetical protein